MAFTIPKKVDGDIFAWRCQLHQMLDEDVKCHVSEGELACHDKDETPYPEDAVQDGSLEKVLAVFEAIREACGNKPIRINCAYRTPEHNKVVGGGKRSQHLLGRALDLHPPKGMDADELHEVIVDLAEKDDRVGGVGAYDSFVHVDVRDRKPDGSYARWDFRRTY